jgi:hypothetical protein
MTDAGVIEYNSSDDGGDIVESYNEKKKLEAEIDEHHIGSVTHEMLEVLCPNGETEYFFDKFNNMTEEEALEVITPMIDFHSDDWNFPKQMMEQMKLAVQGKKVYGEHYDRDIRINCYLLKYSSPYPEVRAVADPEDDPDIPVETIRAYFLGIGWAVIGTVVNTFFAPRFPTINLTSAVIQIILYPMGLALQYTLPNWGVTIRGTRHSLNPGPWSYKEQMFATLTFNVAIYTTNAFAMIMIQRLDVYYGNKFGE